MPAFYRIGKEKGDGIDFRTIIIRKSPGKQPVAKLHQAMNYIKLSGFGSDRMRMRRNRENDAYYNPDIA